MMKNKSKLKSKTWQIRLDKHWVMILGIFLVSFALMLPLFLNELVEDIIFPQLGHFTMPVKR